MKKGLLAILMALSLVMLALSGCGGDPAPTPAPEPEPEASNVLHITIKNSSSYIFNEIYVSPTADSNWGDDKLGGTNVLKSNGTYEIEVDAYDFENYDIQIVDEDNDEYEFKYVRLVDGCEIAIGWDSNGLYATITYPDGTEETIDGDYYSASSTSNYSSGNGYYNFTIYNESAYDIYAIYMGPASGAPSDDIDILPSILRSGDSYTVSGQVPAEFIDETSWTLYVEDVDDDTSVSYDRFNLWTVNYVDVVWNSAEYGYVCEFH